MTKCWMGMAVLLIGCASPHEPASPAAPGAPSAPAALAPLAPTPDVHALSVELPTQRVILVDRDEAPLALVQAACSARSLTVVQTAGTEAWGRISARDATNGQVLASWELADGGAGQSWLLFVRASSEELVQQFATALKAARQSG